MSGRRQEWLNSNANRRYPFVEDTVLQTGTIVLPDNLLLDFKASCYNVELKHVQLVSVDVVGAGTKTIICTFNVESTAINIVLSVLETATFPVTASVSATGSYDGSCVFGEGVQALAALGVASYTMATACRIEPALVAYPYARQVMSLQGSVAGSTPVTGDIYVKGGYNCNVTILPDINAVRLDAGEGNGIGVPCDPPTVGTITCKDVFLRINGLNADDNGNFFLSAGPGFSLDTDMINNTIIIRSAKSAEETICAQE